MRFEFVALFVSMAHAAFRPPAVPLIIQSPLVNVWSRGDTLNGQAPSHWTGAIQDMVAMVAINGEPEVLMGQVAGVPAALQLGVVVQATQTKYQFLCHSGTVAVNLTFASPLITSDFELLSRPAHYVTYSVAALSGANVAVKVYFDLTGTLVVRDPTALVSWQRHTVANTGSTRLTTALSIGATTQTPLVDANDRMAWGVAYLVADSGDAMGGGAQMVLEYSNTTRAQFAALGSLPIQDNTQQPAPLYPPGPYVPPTGPQAGVDRSGGDLGGSPFTLSSADPNLCYEACNKTTDCMAWAYAVPNCDAYPQPTCWLKGSVPAQTANKCRVSGVQGGSAPAADASPLAAALVFDLGTAVGTTPVQRVLTIAVDEILLIDWFGEPCPPYWRRNLGVGNSTVFPNDMLAAAVAAIAAVHSLCEEFDAKTATDLTSVGGDAYATLAQLVYRQVFGAAGLFWVPSKQTAWYALKEISSCGCLNTADVIYPMFPAVLYFSPELMRLMLVPHLEYAMNFTSEIYPLAWAPHHLGHWPLANLPYTEQENMPLEETSYFILQIASIAQRQGGDLTWLTPYWPVLQTWFNFMVDLLPFPQEQLSTDDFDGPLYNATNLAVKGVAALAAYGYIVEKYTGDSAQAAEIYSIAAQYASVMVEYAWLEDGDNSHFMIGYKGSQGDGGDPDSWPMLYNAYWLRIFGFESLLPNQSYYLDTMRDWYAANKLQKYGLPLNSRKLYTKDDWMTFLAATYFDNSTTPLPSAFSSTLFEKFYAWANATLGRDPLSDWINTDIPTAVGFEARPVLGAMWAPMLVALGPQLGLGGAGDTAVAHANAVFRGVHAQATTAA